MTHIRSVFLMLILAATSGIHHLYAAQVVGIETVSSRPDTVSGGNTLVQLNLPTDATWTVRLNLHDVTSQFHISRRSGKRLALLSGLRSGWNTVQLVVRGRVLSETRILNHPQSGPIFSGPHQQPFICQTQANGLSAPLDSDCNANTTINYYYRSIDPLSERGTAAKRYDAQLNQNSTKSIPGFKVYDPSTNPDDVAKIKLPDGSTVKYIVRREVGVLNRAVYEILFVHEPGQPLPTPWSPLSRGWNGRLVYTFGGGCGGGFHQGVLPIYGMAKYEPLLQKGYAVATSSLNILGNNCNDKVSAETASIVKEHFIKTFGEPAYTIGVGGSGGAVSVYLVAQNYPGILDGIIAYKTAPDIISTVIPAFSDCALLHHALEHSRYSWTEAQKASVSGYATWQACPNKAAWINPTDCDASIPKEMIYDRATNPRGIRCTYYDNAVNMFGRDPHTGFARSTLDNVGIQYGLEALKAGVIDGDRFVELNEDIGGYDTDGHVASARSVADPEALRRAYEFGMVVAGKSLGSIPIIDWNEYTDDLGDFHTRDRAFMTRERLISANGEADNQAVLETPRPMFMSDTLSLPGIGLEFLVPPMDVWLANIAAKHVDTSYSTAIVESKPADLMDGCVATNGERIVEPASYNGPGKCNQMYPSFGNPRVAAGAPIAGDVLKCTLRQLNVADYSNRLTTEQLERLRKAFPTGVCDYTKRGVGQREEPIIWNVIAQ